MIAKPKATKNIAEAAAYQRITTSRRRLTWQRKLFYRLCVPIAMIVLRLLWLSYRIEKVIGEEHIPKLLAENKVFLPTLWHQHLFLCVKYLRRMYQRGLRLGFLISPSVDGEVAALVVQRIGGHVIRGSSTRTGAHALRTIYKAMREQHISPLITPDGPRGPRCEFKPGAIYLARISGTPIVPMAFAAARIKIFRTWDYFVLPLPFSRVVVAVGEPVYPKITPDPASVEQVQAEFSQKLADLFLEARASLQQAQTSSRN